MVGSATSTRLRLSGGERAHQSIKNQKKRGFRLKSILFNLGRESKISTLARRVLILEGSEGVLSKGAHSTIQER